VAERLQVREIDDDEGRRLVRIIRRGSGSVVTWRRAQMVLLSAQGMNVPAIAKVAFTSEDRVRNVIRNFNARVEHLYPIADREITPEDGDPEIVFCVDESSATYARRRSRATWPACTRARWTRCG
jgi:hypothetical protein